MTSVCVTRYMPFSKSGLSRISHGPLSGAVGQPPTYDTFERDLGSLGIIDAKPCAVAVSEIKFVAIPMKVPFAHDLIGADQPALEDRKEAFEAVGMHAAAHPFALAVIDGLMARDVHSGGSVILRAIGEKHALGVDVLIERPQNLGRAGVVEQRSGAEISQ